MGREMRLIARRRRERGSKRAMPVVADRKVIYNCPVTILQPSLPDI